MILDGLLVFMGQVGANNALTGQAANGAGTTNSTNTIDTAPNALGGNKPHDLGMGQDMNIEISIISPPSAGTSVRFQLVQADDAAISSNVQVISATGDIPIASLPAGTVLGLKWGRSAPYKGKRYVAMQQVNVGAVAGISVFASATLWVQDGTAINDFATGYAIQ